MLTPEYIQSQLAKDLELLMSEYADRVTEDIARRIAKMGNITDTAEWQMQMLEQAGLLKKDILLHSSQYDEVIKQTIKTTYENAGIENVRQERLYIGDVSIPEITASPASLRILNAQVKKTTGEILNLTKTTATTSQRLFIKEASIAEMHVSNGTMDYQTAIRKAIKGVADEGIKVIYPSGHEDTIEVATRRAVVTGVNQTMCEVNLQYADEMDCDLMELTAHMGARPSHAEWQGQLVSRNGRKGYLSLSDIGYGTGDGFAGWNCRHNWHMFFEGISSRVYDKDRLKQLDARNIDFEGKKYTSYEISQMQRSIERNIRKTRRELMGYDAGIKGAENRKVKEDLKKVFGEKSQKLKAQEKQLMDFVSTVGREDSSRVSTYGFGKSVSQKAVHANKAANILQQLVGFKANNGVVINEVSTHVGGSAYARNLSSKMIEDALKSPLKTNTIRADRSQQLIGKFVTAVLNVDTGRLVTVWPTSSSRAKKLMGG